MRNMHTLVYRAIITLVKSEHLEHYRKDMKFFDRESGSVKTAPGSFILSDK